MLRLLVLPFCFIGFLLQGQDISWVPQRGPSGGAVIDMEVISGRDTVFLLDSEGRPFVSFNAGASWRKIVFDNNSERTFNDIEIIGTTVFLVGEFGLYASTDGGYNFENRMTGNEYTNGQRMKRRPVSGDLVALGAGGLYKSIDGGQNWSPGAVLSGLDQGYQIVVNSVDQIFILRDNASFVKRPFRSSDGGDSFVEASSGIPTGHQVLSLAADNDGEKIYCITTTDIFASTDGSSWTSIKDATISDPTISDYPSSYIEISADNTGMFFVDNVNHKLYAKAIDAASWTLRSGTFPTGSVTATCVAALDYPANPTTATAYIGSSSGVYKTVTGGASVSSSNAGFASIPAKKLIEHGGYLFLGTVDPNASPFNFNYIELLRSPDQGNNFSKITGIPSPFEDFSANESGLFVLDVTNVLYRSTNEGASWSSLSPPSGGFVWVKAIGQSKVFGLAGTSSPAAFYYSSDNGSSWTNPAISISGLPSNFSIDPDEIRMASDHRMLLSLFDFGSSTEKYYRIDFTYNSSNVLTSAVATLVTLSMAIDEIDEVHAANNNFYIVNNSASSGDQLAFSSNGGVNWTTRSLPECDDVFVLPNGYILLAENASTDKLYLSRDNGATFLETSVPTSLNTFDIEDAGLDQSGFAYLAVNGNYLYQSRKPVVIPDPLANLEEVGYTGTAVALRWDNFNFYDHDVIVERSLNGGEFREVGEVFGTFCGDKQYHVDSGLQPSSTYAYRLKARNAAGASVPTATVTVTTLSHCTPNLPANGTWTAVNAGEDYAVIGTPKQVSIKHLGDGKYLISDIALGLVNFGEEPSSFFVSCGTTLVGEAGDVNPNGSGTWNDETKTLKLKWRSCNDDKTETIILTPSMADETPDQPEALYAYVISNTAVELKWRAGFNEKTYVIERSLNQTSGFAEVAMVDFPETTVIDNGPLTEGTTYYYRLKSLNGNTIPDESEYSSIAVLPFRKPNFLVANNAITAFESTATIGSIWADFDNDGLQDYFTMSYDATNNETAPLIFKNTGTDFEMLEIDLGSEPYFLPSVLDIDNDGKTDLAMAGDGTLTFDIFRGNGDFTFSKVPSGQLGDLGSLNNEISGSSWADVNNDGLLDAVMLHQDDGSFSLYTQNPDHTFTLKFQGPPSEDESILLTWADYNNDGFQDFIKGNLDGAGGLYRNNGNNTFTLITNSGFDGSQFFTAAWGDYNNDGNIDLFCGSVAENALYKNNGDGTFTKEPSTTVAGANFCLSATWGDFNNDGFLDLLTTGFLSSETRLFIRDPSVTSSVAFNKINTEKINDILLSHYSVGSADVDGNGLLDVGMSAFIFDDEQGDAFLPASNNFYKNNNPVRNWSQVKLVPKNGSEAIGARVTLSTASQSQTRELSSVTSLASRNSLISHFGLGSVTNITNVRVRWPNGSIQNYPLPPANQLLVIDEDVEGPAITSKVPEHEATGVAASTTITINFDEGNLPVPGKKLYVIEDGETAPVFSIDVSNAAKTDNQYVFTLPANLQSLTKYHITLDAAAFRDRYANPSALITQDEWTFTTINLADSEPPQITFTVPAAQPKGFGTVNANITVTDNQSVSSVKVSIRKITGSEYQVIDATPGESNSWSAAISETGHFDAIGTEFYINATDVNGNVKREPAGEATHKVYLKYSAAQAAIPSTSLGIGGSKTSWKVFSIPFTLTAPQNEIISVFDEFSELQLSNKTDYRLITLQTNTSWAEYDNDFTTINRGTGYFINFRTNPGAVDLFDNLQAPANSRSNLFQMSLKAGWNMIGNPYLMPISWDDVAELNSLTGTEAQLKKYSNGSYSNNQDLQPFEGGFVLVETPKTINIPFLGQTSSGGRRGVKQLPNDISGDSWALPLTLRQESAEYNLAGIGMAPDAMPGIDNYDDVTPPRFIDYLEVNFEHPEHIAKRFTRDIVPTTKNHVWEFSIQSNLAGLAELSWNNSPLTSATKDIFLLDVNMQKIVNMKEVSTHRFHPGESSTFRIYYGDDLTITPERVHLGKAFPNPTNGITTIAFSLPEHGGVGQSVVLDIADAMGRTIATVHQGRLNPGYHEAMFDAQGLARGFYTYRLTVRNLGGLTTEVNKLIIK